MFEWSPQFGAPLLTNVGRGVSAFMKKFSIGYRTLKTGIGAALAVAIAQHFDLLFYTAAGILTILSIQSTKKKSLHAVYTRIVSGVIGIILAFAFFETFGYFPVVIGAMLIVFIPIIVALRVSDGFVSSAVIIMHIFTQANFTLALFWNELAIMLIGFGVGLAVNMYMPDISKSLNTYRIRIENLYQKIFYEISVYLRNGDTTWDGKELIEAIETLNKAKALAFQDVENHVTRKDNLYYQYFDMREKQLEIIERVLPKMTALPAITEQSIIVAEFLKELSESVHSGNTAIYFREKLVRVREDLSVLPLPKDHSTFLAHAALYQFIEEMDDYLEIKQAFIGLDVE
jgi:uncharacterized membrane protein YgaE (UPF0421/DUF939 family)